VARPGKSRVDKTVSVTGIGQDNVRCKKGLDFNGKHFFSK